MRRVVLALSFLVLAAQAQTQDSAINQIEQADLLLQREGVSMATVDAYLAVIQKYPDDPQAVRARYMTAECLYQLGDYTNALPEFARVKSDDRVIEASALLRRGQICFEQQDYEKAADHFRKVMKDRQDTYLARDASFALAQCLVVMGEWEDFRKVADRLVEKWNGYGERPELNFAYGVYYHEMGDLTAAKDYFRKIESERSRYYYARCLSQEGQYLKAVQQYRQLLVRYPESSLAEDVHFAIAESFLKSGQMSLARTAFEDLLLAHPDSHHALAARFKLASIQYRDKDYNRTLESLGQLLTDVPQDDPLLEKIFMLQGLSYFALGRETEADHAFSSILQLFPEGHTGSSALFKMIHHYARNENWNQSNGLGHMFIDRFSGDPLEGRVQLIQALNFLELGETEAARDILENLQDRNSGSDLSEKVLFLLTWSYFQENNLNRIVTNYRHMARKLLPTPNPWRGRTYYLIAESYFDLGLYQDSADLYRQVLNDYPFGDVAPYALQGMTAAYSHLGDDQKAAMEQERYLLVISNEASSNPANALAAAGMYFNRKEYQRALDLFEEFLTAVPDSPERPQALYQSGECLYALQYYEDAVARWRQVLNNFPDFAGTVDVMRKLSDTLFGLQMYREAERHYTAIHTSFPDHEFAEEALFNAANCHYNLQDYDTAIAGFENYNEHFPNGNRTLDAQQAIKACFVRGGKDLLSYVAENPDAAFAADVLWEEGSEAFRSQSYESAAKQFEKITLQYSDSEIAGEALYYLAESRFALGDFESSLAAFENFTATFPDDELVPSALLKAGHIFFVEERYAEAAGHFLILADQYAGNDLADLGLYNAGLCYRKLEQWGAYLSNCSEYLDRFPGSERQLDVQLQMAEVLQTETARYKEALVVYDQLLTQPGAPLSQMHYQRGECLSKLGETHEAYDAYQQAADQPGGLDDDYGIAALAKLASAYEESGQFAEARAVYQRIAGGSSNQEWAALARERVTALDQELQQVNAE